MGARILLPLTLANVAFGSRDFNVKRQITELRDSYDLIIAGGGTTGLTVADRLSAAFPNRTFDPPGSPPRAPTFDYSVPVPGLNNRSASLAVGQTVGGSSAVNGQFFDRGSRHDYDNWATLASPSAQDEIKWDWEGLLPYFKKVTRVVYSGENNHMESVPKVEIHSLTEGTVLTVTAKLEVRSGIGPAELLERAGIDVINDLPGVGYNFQDHGGPSFGVNNMLSNDETYLQESIEAFNLTPAQGPYTLGLGNTAVYLSLANITTSYKDIVASVRQQIESGEAATYLPSGAGESVVKGYLAQLEILAAVLENPTHPIFEAPFQGPPTVGFLLKPLSRGSVLLDPDDHDAEPVITYGTLANPIDVDIMASFVPLMRSVYSTPTMQEMGVVETAPGLAARDDEQIRDWIRQATVASFQHPCCTAAMMPKELGGVVGSDLKVFGVGGLRVADASIMPLLPGTHTSATCYAIGEKYELMLVTWYM
ncbi:putative alcohol oxidase protein [Eutypa lata UCREL1]|uniref:Putative alcohol oxidase protein n=1 Tax=Eutypa lata (strain UCR-EL1) TaxID=1287681 RepID=M7STQ6_EUTLA|nr:putative alcohol oxidase protein [Eutypa lata UCREL1]